MKIVYVVLGIGLWPQNYDRMERYSCESEEAAESWIALQLAAHPNMQEALTIEKRWTNGDFR